MSAQHTPGPWRWWPCKDGSYQPGSDYVQIAAADEHVARINLALVTKADLFLMVAAPDLLSALLMVLDEPNALDGRPRTAEYVNAAIAKATGEGV